MSDLDWIVVYSAVTVTQVYIFKAALEDAGIQTLVENEPLQGAYAGVSLSNSQPKLLVPQEQEQEARQIIAEIISASAAESNPEEAD